MKQFLQLFLLGFLVAAGFFVTLNYHFLVTDERVYVSRKSELSFSETVIDARGWGLADYLRHPTAMKVLAKEGFKDLFGSDGPANGSPREAIEKGKKALDEGLERVQEQLRK